MTALTLRQETISMIETMPDEYVGKIFEFVKSLKNSFTAIDKEEARKKKIFARLDELFAKEPPLTEERKRRGLEKSKKFMRATEEFRKAIGDNIPWSSEEEMIEELARDRRERMQREKNYA